MKKKLLALLCLVAMLVAMIPTNVSAAEGEVQVYIGLYYVNENGEYSSAPIMYKVPSGITKGEAYAQAQEQIDALQHGYKYDFIGWEGGLTEAEMSEVLTGTLSKNVYAHYEKYDVNVEATYLNAQGEKEQTTLTVTVEDGQQIKDAFENVVIENERENRIGWVSVKDVESEVDIMDLDGIFGGYAVYDDMVPVELWAEYISQHNAMGPSSIIQLMPFYVSADATDEEISEAAINYFKETDEKENAWEGLEEIIAYDTVLDDWSGPAEVEGFYYADNITLGVTYASVPMYLEYPDGEEEWVIVGNGETFTFPTEYKGYALTWNYSSSVNEVSDLEEVEAEGVKEVTIVEGMYFYYANAVQGEKLYEYVEVDEENTALTADELEQIIASNMDVTIDTNNGVIFNFTAGSMSEVEGKTEYDFGVEIVEELATALLEKAPFKADDFVLRVNYNYSGELPGEAQITIMVGTEYAGKTLYYYLVKDNGEFEYTGKNAVVNANGEYTITQDHCSDYVIAASAPEEEENPQNPNEPTIPAKGDFTGISYGILMLVGMCVVAFTSVKRRKTA